MSMKAVAALIGVVALLGSVPAIAAPPAPEYVQFSPSATKGALYRPDPGIFRALASGF
jgi:hypothetical protein